MNTRKNRAELYVNSSDGHAELGESFQAIPFDETWDSNVTVVKWVDEYAHPALRLERSRNVQWHTGHRAVSQVIAELHEQHSPAA